MPSQAEQSYAAANAWQRLGERVDDHLLALPGAKSLTVREGTDILTFEDGSQLVFYPRAWEWVTPLPQDLLTAAQVAADLGISGRLVRHIAVRDGVGSRVGRDWVFGAADLERLRAGIRGGEGKRGRPLRNQRVLQDRPATP
jgi:hypothetical protein